MVRETGDVGIFYVSFNNAVAARRVVFGRGTCLQGSDDTVQVFYDDSFGDDSRVFFPIYARDSSERLKTNRSRELARVLGRGAWNKNYVYRYVYSIGSRGAIRVVVVMVSSFCRFYPMDELRIQEVSEEVGLVKKGTVIRSF